MGFAWLRFDPGLRRSGSGLALTGAPRPTSATTNKPSAPPSFEFEFPDMLRKMEVMVPEQDLDTRRKPVLPPPALPPKTPDVPAPAVIAQSPAQPAPPPRAQPQTAIPPPRRSTSLPQVAAQPTPTQEANRDSFVLQLGAFKQLNELERFRARLALLGVETRVQKVTINNNETFHRLRAGPFHSQQNLDEVRRLLTRNNIKSVIIRWKG
jgi:cell division protein FtsN